MSSNDPLEIVMHEKFLNIAGTNEKRHDNSIHHSTLIQFMTRSLIFSDVPQAGPEVDADH